MQSRVPSVYMYFLNSINKNVVTHFVLTCKLYANSQRIFIDHSRSVTQVTKMYDGKTEKEKGIKDDDNDKINGMNILEECSTKLLSRCF